MERSFHSEDRNHRENCAVKVCFVGKLLRSEWGRVLFWTKAGRFCPWKSYESFFFKSIAKVFDATLGTQSTSLHETMAMILSLRFDRHCRRHGRSIETSMLTSNGRHGTISCLFLAQRLSAFSLLSDLSNGVIVFKIGYKLTSNEAWKDNIVTINRNLKKKKRSTRRGFRATRKPRQLHAWFQKLS